MRRLASWITAHPVLTVVLASLVLRLPFLDGSVDFFDSPQYLWRALLPSLIEALSTGHAPYHPGYVGWIWLVHHLLPSLPTALAAAWVNVLFSTLALVATFLLTDRLLGRRSAWLTTLLVALSPYFWVGSITILVDPVMITWWVLSLWLYLVWLDTRQHRPYLTALPWLLAAGLALGLAILAHTQIVFWGLGFIALIILRRLPTDWLRTVIESLPFALGPLAAIGVYVALLLHAGHNESVSEAVRYLLGGNAGDHAPFALDLTIRNSRLVLTSVFLLAAAIATLVLIARRPRVGWSLALWLWPGAVISSAYMYTNLSGRSTMPAVLSAGLAVTALLLPVEAKRPSRWQWTWVGVLVLSLLVASLPLVTGYGRGLSVNEALGEAQRRLPPDGVYLGSPEARTLTNYPTSVFLYDDSQATIETALRSAVDADRPAFVGSDAATFSAYAYDGRSLRVFAPSATRGDHGSLGSFLWNEFTADVGHDVPGTPTVIYALGRAGSTPLVERYQHSLEAMAPGSRLVLGRVVDTHDQPVSRLEVNVHGSAVTSPLRIDASDWLASLIRATSVALGYQTTDPLNWSYTDPEGVVAVKLPDRAKARNFRLIPHPIDTARTQAPPPLFLRSEATTLEVEQERIEGTARELAVRLAAASDSVLLTVEALGDKRFRALVTEAAYTLPVTETVPASALAGQVGEITPTEQRSVPTGTVGDAMFGPWKTLVPGTYTVTWRVVRTAEGEGNVVKLDVSTGFGTTTFVERVIDAAQLPLGESTAVTLEFTIDQDTELVEFRARALGGPGFTLESLTVQH